MVTATTGGARSRLYQPLPDGMQKLRIVVLIDNLMAPTWIAETLAALVDSDVAEVVNVSAIAVRPLRRFPMLFDLFLRSDAVLAGVARAATASSSLPGRLPQIVFSACIARPNESSLEVSDLDQKRLAGLRPDLIIAFGLPAVGSDLASIARHGAWSFDRRSTDPHRAATWLLAPLLRGDPVTLGGLNVIMSDTGVRVLLQPSWCATSQLSFARNRAHQLLRVPPLLLRALRQLARGVPLHSQPATEFKPPGTFRMLQFLLRLVGRGLRRQIPRLGTVENWFLGVRRSDHGIDPAQPNLRDVTRVDPPAEVYWADPCAVQHDGRDYIFLEEYVYAERRGRISVIELDQQLAVKSCQPVLQTAWHLSYPCVFEDDGQTLMTVESSEAQCVNLYRATQFPTKWEEVSEILRGWRFVDTTLHHHDGRWYLFANVTESALGYDERIWDDLFLFIADTPTGPWQPHPLNPIVSDVRHARPAGRLFEHDGRLIRPSQDCSIDYGYAVVFNEVLTLSPEEYSERRIGSIEPRWSRGLRGCHTYTRAGDLEAVDGKELISRGAAHEFRVQP
ncbi:MAG: hypothetical protein WBP11_01395 [Dokdonella sp.]